MPSLVTALLADLIVTLLACQSRDAEVAEAEVCGGVVALEADGTRIGAIAFASVVGHRTVVDEIGDLHAVDPGGKVLSLSKDGHGEPLAVLGHLLAGGAAILDAAGAVIDGG